MREDFKSICKIDKFKPFNEVLYKDCYYHGLIPIFKCFVGFIESFLLNDICMYYTYYKDENKIGIRCDTIFQETEEEILSKYGIGVNKVKKTDTIVKDLAECISDNRPAIIRIDCFYEPLRLDSYQSFHASHAIPVYGYNLEAKYINILEAKFIDSVSYSENELQFADLEKAYQGYVDRFLDITEKDTLVSFYQKKSLCPEEYRELYNEQYVKFCKYLLNGQNRFIESQSSLKMFAADIQNILLNDTQAVSKLEYLISDLTSMINNMNIQRYLFIKIFQFEKELICYIDLIAGKWKSIRAILTKYKFKKRIDEKSVPVIEKKLNEIIELEEKRMKLLNDIILKDEKIVLLV